MALVKRSPKRTANWPPAIAHAPGGIPHSFSARFKTRKRRSRAASSVGKWPLPPPARRHPPLLLGPVQDQEQDLRGGPVGREMAPRLDGPPQLGVERLDGVRGVEQPPDLGREGVERHHLTPGPAPARGDGGILA